MVGNLAIGREPVYALGEWAAPLDPALLGLAEGEAGLLNDDRVGRTLARLFDADRAWLLTRLVLDAVARCSASTARGCTTTPPSVKRHRRATRTPTGARGAASRPPTITLGHNPRTTAPT